MLVLPIKKQWFNKILSGEKKEEYREIKPYYTTRFLKVLGFPKEQQAMNEDDIKELLEKMETLKNFDVVFRNGYSSKSPMITAKCSLSIGTGRTEWGAEDGVMYYRLHIKEVAE